VDLPRYQTSLGSATGYVCSISLDQVRFRTNSVVHLTLSALAIWKTANLENPNMLQWRKGADPQALLADAGLVRVVETNVVAK